MSTQQARTVTAHINDKGTVEEVDDPFYHHFWDPDARLDRALSEEHYGWTLKPLVDKGIALNAVFPGVVDICTNDPDDTTHLNTIATQKPQVVKLDVGYWGAYGRQRDFQSDPPHGPPQRNFGMIQGHDIWLCNFAGTAGVSGNTNLPDKNSPAGKLLEYLSTQGLSVEILTYAVAPANPFTQDLDPDKLYILFADLHLPERLPDAPSEAKRQRLPDGDLRLPLRKELRNCQHEFGTLAGNGDMDGQRAAKIQDYLEGKADNANDLFKVVETHTFSSDKTFTYFRDNVLAEKAILDRTIRTRCGWFYGPAAGNDEKGKHEEKPDFSKISPSPSVDLATFLAAVFKTRSAGANIDVIQLGDLYELWMGREFLYLDFPVTTTFDYFSLPSFAIGALQTWAAGQNDKFQYRQDEDWGDRARKRRRARGGVDGAQPKIVDDGPVDGVTRHPVKRYPFHEFPTYEMRKRHKTGWDYLQADGISQEALARDNITPDIIARVKARLAERGRNVESFSLPLSSNPADRAANVKLRAVLTDAGYDLDTYKRQGAGDPPGVCPPPDNEYLWHGLIFDLFRALNFRNIHGNHDGYRSDPLLRDSISIQAEEWISLPGIWIEHGHRWDEFNRDGCAIGAGMTNMVYYYNLAMIEADQGSTAKEWFMNQDAKCFIPGAAQWFLLANMTPNEFPSRDGSMMVLPFGIIVVGHTHHPDLCYIAYEKQGAWDSFVEVAGKIGREIVGGVKDAAKAVGDAAQNAAGAIGDAADKVGSTAKKAGSAVSDAAGSVANKIKSPF